MVYTPPETSNTVYILSESRVIRTGILLYYDALLMSDLVFSSLSALNVVNTTLPSVDPTTHTLPANINASIQNIVINL
jgi:hypothetical protein